jgi:hypothetical protein
VYKRAFRVWLLAPVFGAAAGIAHSHSATLSYLLGGLAVATIVVGLGMAVVGIGRKEPATRNR